MGRALRALHPGEILREDYLRPLGITPHALARALKVSRARIYGLVDQERGITPDLALRLSRYFGGDPVAWLNLQLAYDLQVAQADAPKIAREIVPIWRGVASDGPGLMQ